VLLTDIVQIYHRMTVFYICPLQRLAYCVKEKGVFLIVASTVALLCLRTDTVNGSALQQNTVLSITLTVTFLLLLQLA